MKKFLTLRDWWKLYLWSAKWNDERWRRYMSESKVEGTESEVNFLQLFVTHEKIEEFTRREAK